MKRYILTLALAAVLAVSGAAPVLAQQNQNQGSSSGNSGNTSSGNSNAGTGTGSTNAQQGVDTAGTGNQTQSGQDNSQGQQQGLSDDRKQTCENRKGNIDKTMEQYSATVQNRLALFNKIAERVQTYYEENNLSVANYEQLMAEVMTLRQTATESMNQVRQGASIDCGSADPIGTAQQFRTNVQTAQQSLQQYRLAIHNLLTAVISAAESAEQ